MYTVKIKVSRSEVITTNKAIKIIKEREKLDKVAAIYMQMSEINGHKFIGYESRFSNTWYELDLYNKQLHTCDPYGFGGAYRYLNTINID